MSWSKRHLYALPLALMLNQTVQAENVRLHGALVAEPCDCARE